MLFPELTAAASELGIIFSKGFNEYGLPNGEATTDQPAMQIVIKTIAKFRRRLLHRLQIDWLSIQHQAVHIEYNALEGL